MHDGRQFARHGDCSAREAQLLTQLVTPVFKAAMDISVGACVDAPSFAR